ncbi:GATA transcription factor 5-like isoform X3 [Durio zibethinus]|uniref:GATA transcription factor 5-like isoform X3 n=1 Tax=Durio zibethinus TaxID=66656 RepID=A0A6P5YXG9_DURZI|nr:GATA transcription factor 5-like isoform X3 [Durio zibethinus]
MAQFTPQGRLKLLFHGDGMESKDPFHYKLVSNVFGGSGGLKSLQVHNSTTRRLYFSYSLKKGSKFNAKACLNASNEGIYDEADYDSEFETDDLACFRGLVLDSSYRYCEADENLTIDHVLPVARGGEWKWENLVAACAKCNSMKGQKTPDEANMKLIKVPKEVDMSLEWLSIFVEDCFSSSGNYIPVGAAANVQNKSTTATKPTKSLEQKPQQTPPSLQKFSVPGKARSKRKRAATTLSKTKMNPFSSWSNHLNSHNPNLQLACSDPPLLQQAYWLAESELIVPKKEEDDCKNSSSNLMGNSEVEQSKKEEMKKEKVVVSKESLGSEEGNSGQQPRRCTHCLAQRTPQWRAGPLGPKTLCNACGVRYKSGRLLPEYRPAKSPTFVSYLHSNSHKKVMEMRMALLSSIPSEQ